MQLAYDRVFLNRRARVGREVARILGACLFGVFPGSFWSALGARDHVQVGVYTRVGFVGLALIFWGFLDA